MGLKIIAGTGSQIVTDDMWNGFQYNTGSEFDVAYGIQTGSDYLEYDASDNLISGNHFSTTGSWYESYEYDATGDVVSGTLLRDGKTVTSAYHYDSNGNLSGITFVVT